MNLQQFGLPGKYRNKTMSDISKSIQKKYKDRNDPISKRTMEDELQRLSTAQESIKTESAPNGSNKFWDGGEIANQALRLAPAIGNISELGRLKEPTPNRLTKLQTKMSPNLINEQTIQNNINDQYGNINKSVAVASGGSGAAYRKNLLAAKLGKANATSDALIKGRQYNDSKKEEAFRFNSGIDKYNAQITDRENELNQLDTASYENSKHSLRQGIFDNIGDFGKEQTMADSIGKAYGYDIHGNKIKNPTTSSNNKTFTDFMMDYKIKKNKPVDTIDTQSIIDSTNTDIPDVFKLNTNNMNIAAYGGVINKRRKRRQNG